MSTKTTIKRIALVAVSALGLGVLTSVAPASATAATSVTAGTVGASRVGANLAVTMTFGLPTTFGGSTETLTIGAKVISAPTGSAFNTVRSAANATPVVNGVNTSGVNASGNLIAAKIGWTTSSTLTANLSTSAGTGATRDATNVIAGGSDSLTAAAYLIDAAYSATNTTAVTTLNITPDVAGTYTVLVHSSGRSGAGADGAFASGDKSTTFTFTTAGAAASATISRVGGSVVGGGTYGALYTISLKDAAGVATVLGPNESLDLATSGLTSVAIQKGLTSGDAITSIGSDTTGVRSGSTYYVRLVGPATIATAETGSFTVTGAGTLPNTLTANTSVTTVKATTPIATSIALHADNTSDVAHATVATTVTADYGSASSSHVFTVTTTGAGNTSTTTALNEAVDITLPSALQYSTFYSYAVGTATAATKTAKLTVSAAVTAADTRRVDIAIPGTAVATSVSYVAPVNTTFSVIKPEATITSATGAKHSITVQAKDQYGNAIAFQSISVSVSGRNTVASTTLGVTNADGQLTYTYTDAGTSGTSDVVSFSAPNSKTASRTINYGTVTVGTVTIKGGNNTTTGVAATTAQWKDIDAGEDGASATTHDVIATVKDASGNLLAGVPVSFTVAGSGVAITSNTATVYTGSDGTATAQVYAWTAGSYVVTATAGGKTGTSTYQFRQSAAGEERSISASTSGNLVTAKVVDRFGNPVPAVKVWGTITGGYFGTGTLKTDSTTDNDGVVSFIVNGGASTVTFTTYDPTSSSATPGSGQSCARKGAVDCNALAADDTAFTAYTAGTATVAEEGVGASFDAAGVASVSVDVATTGTTDAVDAANDAVEAANAATDAANAAAEAADAATAAAQDAQAAVADLAAQVATLISGIKAQITRLTNLVVKIQKKVRA